MARWIRRFALARVVQLLKMSNRPATLVRRETLFREAAAIIERDYRRPLDLNTVAAQIATSRRRLRAFHEVGHTTFRTYLARVRMQEGARAPARGLDARSPGRSQRGLSPARRTVSPRPSAATTARRRRASAGGDGTSI